MTGVPASDFCKDYAKKFRMERQHLAGKRLKDAHFL